MNNTQIVVEGESDKKFLADFESFIVNPKTSLSFSVLNGFDVDLNILKKSVFTFQRNSLVGGKNLLIIDANGNCEKRTKDLEKLRKDLQIEFECFLFPNNSDTGNLETLLCKIINPINKPVFECFEAYQVCLEGSSLKAPGLKSKIFAYLETLYGSENDKRLQYKNRDYLNPEHWNLDHEYLTPLKQFLLAHIQPSAQ